MAYLLKYKTLFKFNLIHRYFLDKGEEKFEQMSADKQEKRLDLYDLQDFITIIPTKETQRKQEGHQLIYKLNNLGFNIIAKVANADSHEPFIALDEDLCLTFLIKTKSNLFLNYTGLDLGLAGRLYYFSNKRISTEANNFPLLSVSGKDNVVNGNYVLTQNSTDKELSQLNVNDKNKLFGIIRIYIKSTENTLNVTDEQGKIPLVYREFEIVFDNRKTTWRYVFKGDQTVENSDDVEVDGTNKKVLVTKSEYPLTSTGFISVKHDDKELPNPDAKQIKPLGKIYSEVFI